MGFFDDIKEGLRDKLRGEVDVLLKGDADMLPTTSPDLDVDKGSIGRKAIIDDPFFDQVHQHFIFKNKMSRISNKTLKDTSVRDWVVSAIIQARADTLQRFSRPQVEKFDMGFKVVKRDNDKKLSAQEKEEIANIEDFIYHCGRKKDTPAGDEMLFGEFLKLTTRDAITFGHVAVEKILTRNNGLHRFRPLPAESMYLINQKTSRKIIEEELKQAKKMYKLKELIDSENDPEAKQVLNEPDIAYYKYVQMSHDNRVLSAFGDEDMVWKLFNPQNFSDAMGYCYSPLELAIINTTNHLNIENYNANFFTHGYAARGILHLKGTVTQAQLTAFRRQFYNTISGAQHAWRTPIIAGLDDVEWVSLAGSAKEMEYLQYNNHVIRALCTQFSIDPMEIGLDYLLSSAGKASSNPESNESKINYSRERGLYPILMFFEDMMNCQILPALDEELAKKYHFQFVGYTDETPQTNVALLQAEMTVHSTMNDLLTAAGKEQMTQDGCDLPLQEAFWNLIEKNYTRGEIREKFFGDKGASQRRELQYIPADQAFLAWQQMLMTIDRTKIQDQQQQQQMEQEAQQAEHEKQQNEQANKREQEQHDLAVEEAQARHAHGAVNHESLKDVAKTVGLGSKSLNVGGKQTANPINSDIAKDET